jgi:hypothetical protein
MSMRMRRFLSLPRRSSRVPCWRARALSTLLGACCTCARAHTHMRMRTHAHAHEHMYTHTRTCTLSRCSDAMLGLEAWSDMYLDVYMHIYAYIHTYVY